MARFLQGAWWRRASATLGLALLSACWGANAQTKPLLRVLAWPGYADVEVVREFEQRTGAKVQVTIIDNDDLMWERLSQPSTGEFDVFAVNTAELQRYIKARLVQPLDRGQIPNTQRQLPRFQKLDEIAGLVHAGAAYAIPYTYSEMGLIYDRNQVREAPTSINALWDPRYRGRVLLYNGASHSFSLAAQALGLPTPYAIGSSQWQRVVDKLIALRRNAQSFYTQPEESVELFRRGQAALMFANYGAQQVKLLTAAGLQVGYAIPSEGALAWLDCWAITRNAQSVKLAHAWINFMLEDAPGQLLLTRQGLPNTTTEPPYLRPQDRLKWLEPVEDVERRNRLWERILAGDRALRVNEP